MSRVAELNEIAEKLDAILKSQELPAELREKGWKSAEEKRIVEDTRWYDAQNSRLAHNICQLPLSNIAGKPYLWEDYAPAARYEKLFERYIELVQTIGEQAPAGSEDDLLFIEYCKELAIARNNRDYKVEYDCMTIEVLRNYLRSGGTNMHPIANICKKSGGIAWGTSTSCVFVGQ